jgi:hypothetical protein
VNDDRVTVRVVITVGGVSQVISPWHPLKTPLRVPAADIAADAGLPANELPGREFTAEWDGAAFRDYRLVHDPRL